MIKRAFDMVVSAVGLILFSPLYLAIAVAIKVESRGPVFFRQIRVGRFGRPFRIHKFRSMTAGTVQGPQITVGRDPRITKVGQIIRDWKLDELAQLIDVFIGRMSLVGPRPEVLKYVDMYPPDLRTLILSARPGITDPASIRFRNESEILAQSVDPDRTYREEILPLKLQLQADYVQTRTFAGDCRIIWNTLAAVLLGR